MLHAKVQKSKKDVPGNTGGRAGVIRGAMCVFERKVRRQPCNSTFPSRDDGGRSDTVIQTWIDPTFPSLPVFSWAVLM